MDLQTRYALRREQGARFDAAGVAELYRHRPPYSDEVYEVLLTLLGERRRVVLDAGSGPGKLARILAPDVERVDAVDPSADMLRVGRALPGGDHPRLRWIHASLEEAELEPPYGLAVAGASFHWFDADRVLSRLARVVEPGGLLVLLDGDAAWSPPWAEAEREVMIELVTRMEGRRPTWRTVDAETTHLLVHPRFKLEGTHVTAPDPFEQTLEAYIACQHSRATFTPDAMGPELARELDDALREVLLPHAQGGRIRLLRRTRLEWGRPLPPD